MSETIKDYDQLNEVADLQAEYQSDREKEELANSLVEQIDQLEDKKGLVLSWKTDDQEVLNLVYGKLGIDEEKVAQTFEKLKEDNASAPNDSGKLVHKPGSWRGPNGEGRLQDADAENSTPPSDRDHGNWWKLVPTKEPNIFLNVGFKSPADRSAQISVFRIDDVRGYLSGLEREQGQDAPLAPAIRTEKVMEDDLDKAA